MAISAVSVVSNPNHQAVVVKFTASSVNDRLYIKGGSFAEPTLERGLWFFPANYRGKSNGASNGAGVAPSINRNNRGQRAFVNTTFAPSDDRLLYQDDGVSVLEAMMTRAFVGVDISNPVVGVNYLLLVGLDAETAYEFGDSDSFTTALLTHTTSSAALSESMLLALTDAGAKVPRDADDVIHPAGSARMEWGTDRVVFHAGATGGDVWLNGANINLAANSVFAGFAEAHTAVGTYAGAYVFGPGYYRGGVDVNSPSNLVVVGNRELIASTDPQDIGVSVRTHTGRPLYMTSSPGASIDLSLPLMLCGRAFAGPSGSSAYRNFIWLEPPAPSVVINPVISNVGPTSATLSWTDPPFLSKVRITPRGRPAVEVAAGVQTANLTGLTSSSIVDFTLETIQDYIVGNHGTA